MRAEDASGGMRGRFAPRVYAAAMGGILLLNASAFLYLQSQPVRDAGRERRLRPPGYALERGADRSLSSRVQGRYSGYLVAATYAALKKGYAIQENLLGYSVVAPAHPSLDPKLWRRHGLVSVETVASERILGTEQSLRLREASQGSFEVGIARIHLIFDTKADRAGVVQLYRDIDLDFLFYAVLDADLEHWLPDEAR